MEPCGRTGGRGGAGRAWDNTQLKRYVGQEGYVVKEGYVVQEGCIGRKGYMGQEG